MNQRITIILCIIYEYIYIVMKLHDLLIFSLVERTRNITENPQSHCMYDALFLFLFLTATE